jgi:hypothetical protein
MSEVVVHGKWSKFEERGEWRQFEVDVPGKQWPLRLATKRPELIAAMMELRDKDATFNFTEKESEKLNEKTGKPYVNRYLNNASSGHVGQQTAPSGGIVGERGKEDLSAAAVARIEEQQRRSLMSYSWGHAIQLVASGKLDTPNEQGTFARVQELQRLIYRDICGEWGMQREASYLPPALQPEPTSTEPELSERDQDIPF